MMLAITFVYRNPWYLQDSKNYNARFVWWLLKYTHLPIIRTWSQEISKHRMCPTNLPDRAFMSENIVKILLQWILISQTLSFLNLPITRTKRCFLTLVKCCNFTPDFSNYLIFWTNFHFPWRFKKFGFHLIHSVVLYYT